MRILGVGAATALAPTLAGTLAAIAERDTAYHANAAFVGAAMRPQVCAFRASTGVGAFAERVAALAGEAVADIAATGIAPAALAIVLPERSPGEGLTDAALRDAAAAVRDAAEGVVGTVPAVRALATGSAGVGTLLAEVGGATLIVAVDSYCDRARLAFHDERRALHSRSQAYGFVPGEAAAALLVAPGAGPGAAVLAAAAGRERVPEHVEDETTFAGLSDAVVAACDGAGGPLSAWLSDWNNSRYRATELSFAMSRAAAVLGDVPDPEHLAITFGDVGAAYGGLAAALLAARGERRGLVSAGSPSGLRSAFVVSGASE